MKTSSAPLTSRNRAFTLMELLVVIAIIGILAALLIPIGAALKKKATRSRAHLELKFVAAAINSYKEQLGHYPPDNSADTNTWISQLFYELRGTVFTNGVYQLESGEGKIAPADFPALFGGTKVGGLVNTTKGVGEDAPVAKNFLTGAKSSQHQLLIQHNGKSGIVLGTTLKGPVLETPTLMLNDGAGNEINPFRYRVSGPNRNNAGSFDLWVDILVGKETNRISNWNDGYEVVP